MKNLYYLLFLALGMAACSVEPLDSTENLLTADAKTAVVANEFIIPEGICAGEPAEFAINASLGSNLQVQQYNPSTEEWDQVFHTSKSTASPQKFWLSFAAEGTYQLRYKVGSGGYSQGMDVVVVNCACEESFNYTPNEDGSYTFTYIPAEDMAAAEVVFTFAQSVVASGYDWPNWNGRSSTRTEMMDLNACSVYTWTLFLTGDCNGSTPESNLWTDFKVNDVSKKGELANIERRCS